MTRRLRRIALAGAAVLVSLLASAGSAAAFNQIKIRGVFLGPSMTDISFIQLQMYAAGQNSVAGQTVRVYNADATLFSSFILPGNVANGINQGTILVGDTLTGGSPDFTFAGLQTSLAANSTAGAACYSTFDCVSWGNFTGDANLPSSAGTPVAGGLSINMVLIRSITPNCFTALEGIDDTNNSTMDFSFGFFPPRNNATPPTEVVCPEPLQIAAPRTTEPTKCKKSKKKKKGKSATTAAKKKTKKKACKKKKKKGK